MAIMLYASGILEEHLNNNNKPFTTQQLTSVFRDYDRIRSKRLLDVVNTWCIWGENDTQTSYDFFNELGSNIIEENVYSPLLFIHDTELDDSWGLTDKIYDEYPIFVEKLREFIDDMADELKETIAQESPTKQLLVLKPFSYSDDKRVIQEYDPDIQSEEFYKIQNYGGFANQAYNYLEKYFKEQEMLVIYANNQVIIVAKFEKAKKVIKDLIDFFAVREKYEKCEVLKGILERWKLYEKETLKKIEDQKNNGKDTSK